MSGQSRTPDRLRLVHLWENGRTVVISVVLLPACLAKEPLYRVHECVFGVLALQSESVDPRR